MQRLQQRLTQQGGAGPPPGSGGEREDHFLITHADCQSTALLQDDIAMAAIRFLALVLYGILDTLRSPNPAAILALTPESHLRDMLNYATFVVNSGAMDLLGSIKQVGHACHFVFMTTLTMFWDTLTQYLYFIHNINTHCPGLPTSCISQHLCISDEMYRRVCLKRTLINRNPCTPDDSTGWCFFCLPGL